MAYSFLIRSSRVVRKNSRSILNLQSRFFLKDVHEFPCRVVKPESSVHAQISPSLWLVSLPSRVRPSIISPILSKFKTESSLFSLFHNTTKSYFPRKWSLQKSSSINLQKNRWNGISVVYGLILSNIAVYSAWQLCDPRFMARHFTVSESNIRQGRWHTVLSSAFSHKDAGHIAANMLTFYFFGSEIGRRYGGQYLLKLYLSGGAVASVCHVLYCHLIYPRIQRSRGLWWRNVPFDAPALGASGAVNAVVILDCLLFPTRIIYLNLILPVPAILLGAAFVLKDLYGASLTESTVGHAGHLGGAAVGAIAWMLL